MESETSFTQFLNALQSHDNSLAQNEIWKRCWSPLVRLVAVRLNRRYCGAADEEDVALSAMNSIFQGVSEKRFSELNDRESFWNLLLTIAYRKAIKHHRRETTKNRGGGNVLNEAAGDSESEMTHWAGSLESSPTEEEIVVAAEEMTEDLDDDILRQIVLLKLQGYTDREVAVKIGVAEKTIARKRERIRAIWSAE